MSNGARHALGFLAGLILAPVIRLGTMYGTQEMGLLTPGFLADSRGRLLGAAALAGVVVLVAFLVGSRMSPLASLIPGLLLSAVAVAWIVAPATTTRLIVEPLPPFFDRARGLVTTYETVLGLLGGVMFFSSLFPSRWRGRAARSAVTGPAPGYTNAPGHVRPLPSGQGTAASPYAAPDDGTEPGPVVPGFTGTRAATPATPPAGSRPPGSPPPLSTPPGPGETPAAGPSPYASPGSPGSPGVGEWTRMYGGDEFKGRS
jgi:hypothetical protein